MTNGEVRHDVVMTSQLGDQGPEVINEDLEDTIYSPQSPQKYVDLPDKMTSPRFMTDTGYCWVILVASFFGYFLNSLSAGAFGLLLPELLEHFGQSTPVTTWIGSLNTSIGAIIGIALAPILAKLGCRRINMIGAVIGTIGYVTSYFTISIVQLYLSYGLLCGIGNGMVFFSSCVILHQHFDRRRTLATALATCGVSTAPLILAPLTRWLVGAYGWRIAILYLGAIYIHGMIGGSLMRPPELVKGKKTFPPISLKDEESHVINRDINYTKKVTGEAQDEVQMKDVQISSTSLSSPTKHIDEKPTTPAPSSHLATKPRTKCCSLCGSIFRTVVKHLNISLLADLQFTIFLLGSFMALFGYIVPYIFLPIFTIRTLDISPTKAAGLISMIAISTVAGRVLSGIIGNWLYAPGGGQRRIFQYSLGMMLCGLANLAVVLSSSYTALCLYAVTFGITIGAYMAIQQPVLIDILSIERFHKSYAILMLCNGCAGLACGPFSGWLVDITGLYSSAFLACGFIQLTGGVLLTGVGLHRNMKCFLQR